MKKNFNDIIQLLMHSINLNYFSLSDHVDQGGGTTVGGGVVMTGPLPTLGSIGAHQLGFGGPPHHGNPGNSDDLRFHGTELVMLYDYKVCFELLDLCVILENN